MAQRDDPGQLDLFGGAQRHRHEVMRVGPAPVDAGLAETASRIPPEIRFGTSSWSFPGWAGIVYDREVRSEELARHGLPAYARHPLLRTVGLDRSYYGPPRVDEFVRYAQEVPDDFRFLIKAHEWCSMVRFPRHPRYGDQGGRENTSFLEPGYARDEVVGPALEGLGDKLGVVLFQFPPQELELISARGKFPDRIHRFLSDLPQGPTYAVEIRNHQLFTPRYLEALRGAGAVHCFNGHPSMHELSHQVKHADPLRDAVVVVRWMLARHHRYDDAKRSYAPFDRLVDPDVGTRGTIAQLCRDAAEVHRHVFVVVNNKAEGSSPLSIAALAREVAGG